MKKLLILLVAVALAVSAKAQVTYTNTITSTSGIPLILQTGSFGTAVTFASATGIPTFAGNQILMAGGSSWTDVSGQMTLNTPAGKNLLLMVNGTYPYVQILSGTSQVQISGSGNGVQLQNNGVTILSANGSNRVLVSGATDQGNASLQVAGALASNQSLIGTTSTIGFLSDNLTATNNGSTGTVQYGPSWVSIGHVWNTSGTPADNFAMFRQELRPVSGTSPSIAYVWSYYIGASATPTYTDLFQTTTTGVFGPITNNSGGLGSASAIWQTFFSNVGQFWNHFDVTNGNNTPTGTWNGLTGKISLYNSIATAGWGVPAIQAAGRSVGAVAAVASVSSYTVGAADGSFDVSANVNVTTSTTHSFTVTCTYTDETNTSRTLTLGFAQLSGGTLLTTITNVTGAGPYESVHYSIRCKASTTITFATAGTFTSVVYNAEGFAVQKA